MTEIVDAEAVEIEEPGQALELRAPAAVNLFHTEDPTEVIARASETATALAAVLKRQRLYKDISGKRHVLVEGWSLLASMMGITAVTVWTRKLENGWEARVEARTLDGRVIGAAEAMCLRSEALWKGRDEFAIRSMAQTRATSKALRQPLGFVIQLAGFQPEPAEEMESTADEPKRSRAKNPTPSRAKPEAGAGADTSSASGASPFKAPAGPRGGQATLLEAAELAKELSALVTEIGATDSLPSIETHAEAGDVPWLKRQIASARKHLEAKAKDDASK